MRTLIRGGFRLLLALVVVAALMAVNVLRLEFTDAGGQRLSFERYEMGTGAADGSAKPTPTGFISGGDDGPRIVPAMPPEKPMDIHTAANYRQDYAIHSCFWPGPRSRAGVFTNDSMSISVDNQFPDTATTYMPTALQLPAGAKLVLKGEFPHMRHWNFNTYYLAGEPQDALGDAEIEPDAGSSNPFREGVPRDVAKRNYTITVESGFPPSQRPANTVYTNAAPGTQVYLWMRNYVPDRSTDFLGGVSLPRLELHTADGQVLKDAAACAATNAPMRGKQLPRTVNPHLYLALSHLPWVDSDNVGASRDDVVPLQKFFSRPEVLAKLFFPWLKPSNPELVGGWWSNRATTYGYAYVSRNFGKVYYLTAKLPKTPTTWHGEATIPPGIEMQYLSVCSAAAPAAGSTPDCLYDEQLLPTLDNAGRYAVVASQQQDRPANAKLECGVQWLDLGNGDGLVGGSPNYGAIINRHTTVNPGFKQSWFAVDRPGNEKAAMGDYLPYLINLKEKAAFEALGCPVDKSSIYARIPKS